MQSSRFKYYRLVRIQTSLKDRTLSPHRHSYYELFFFFNGTGEHLIDFKTFDIAPPSIQLVGPHQLHQVSHSKDSEGYVIKIKPLLVTLNPFLNTFFQFIAYNQHFKAGINISSEESTMLTNSFLFLKNYKNGQSNEAIFALLSALNLFIAILKKYQVFEEDNENHPNNSIFNDFLDLAEQHYLKEKNADFYVQHMHLSLSKLNGIVKDRTGMTVKQFLIQRTLLEAKRLIVHSEKSIKEIAYTLSFLEPAHFSNFFKKHTGNTPKQFKQSV